MDLNLIYLKLTFTNKYQSQNCLKSLGDSA